MVLEKIEFSILNGLRQIVRLEKKSGNKTQNPYKVLFNSLCKGCFLYKPLKTHLNYLSRSQLSTINIKRRALAGWSTLLKLI